VSRKEALKAKVEMWEAVKNFAKKQKVKMTTGLFKRVIQSSIYSAHQGPRECERRRRQMERRKP
jgi:hypothetical protein